MVSQLKIFYSSNQKIKSSLYSPYYAEACNELRGPSPRLSAWATQLRRNVTTVASRWRHCVDLTGPGIELQTSRTDRVRLATELTTGLFPSKTSHLVPQNTELVVIISHRWTAKMDVQANAKKSQSYLV